ncbi:DUF2958 domain-containing protein [Rathayibacter iranicus]|nr:DUF2958 domain-containing protein [Rathayibacter iranicus]
MTSSFDPNQHPRGHTKHPRGHTSSHTSNRGAFTTRDHSEPEAALGLTSPGASGHPFIETQRKLRGHVFLPSQSKTWPAPRSNDATDLADIPFVAHYFVGGSNWYVAELDHQTGEAFGYVDLGIGHGEYGYFNLHELEAIVVRPSGFPQPIERDVNFTPKTKARDVIPKYQVTPVAAS